MSEAEIAEVFDSCLEKVDFKINAMGLEITPQSISKVVKLAMEIVEATSLKGSAQKILVNKIVRQVVVNAPISDEKEKLVLDMIDQDIVGNFIDLVVAASKGKLDINSAVGVASACCKTGCSFCVNQ